MAEAPVLKYDCWLQVWKCNNSKCLLKKQVFGPDYVLAQFLSLPFKKSQLWTKQLRNQKVSKNFTMYLYTSTYQGTDGSKFPLQKGIVTPFLIITYVMNLYLWNNLVNIKYLTAQQVTFRCFHTYWRACNNSGFPLYIKTLKYKCEKGLIWPR